MYKYNAELIRVVDGDTIIAMVDLGFHTWKKVTIRLNGINTPEIRTKDLEEKKRGWAASDRVSSLIEFENDGKFVLISHGVGKFGRCLGDIYLKDVNLNQLLLEEGHATPYIK